MRFQFDVPISIQAAMVRKRQLENEVADIARQLGIKPRMRNGQPLSTGEYKSWKQATRHALVLKESEIRFLKDWVLQRRRELLGRRVDIEDVDDPVDILIAVRAELERLQPEDRRLGILRDTIEQYLTHSA